MIIVAGYFRVAPESREVVLTRSLEAVHLARSTKGCKDFAVSADLVDAARVNVYECWDNEATLNDFRRQGPDDGLAKLVLSSAVQQFKVD